MYKIMPPFIWKGSNFEEPQLYAYRKLIGRIEQWMNENNIAEPKYIFDEAKRFECEAMWDKHDKQYGR
jgi:hypothetical protein